MGYPIIGNTSVHELLEGYQDALAEALNGTAGEFSISSDVTSSNAIHYDVWQKDTCIAHFDLAPMPGCCGMVVSTAAMVYKKWRKKGLGTLLNKIRIDIAKFLGYGVMLCTDVLDNEPQQRILEKNGWFKVFEFDNPRTGNAIGVHVINL
jgi:hypothetical protein